MLAILSPAKTLDFDSPLVTDQHSVPEFTKDSAALVKTLRKLEPADIGSLMGISDKLATLNHDRYTQWSAKFDESLVPGRRYWLSRATYISASVHKP